jgi:hypothetical protein
MVLVQTKMYKFSDFKVIQQKTLIIKPKPIQLKYRLLKTLLLLILLTGFICKVPDDNNCCD